MARLNKMKQWHKHEIAFPDGSTCYILVRAQGDEFNQKFLRLLTQFCDANSYDRDTLLKDHPEDWSRIMHLASLGTTFGGWGNIEDESGNSISDGGDPDNLNPDVALPILYLDEVSDAWITCRNRLTRERQARWDGTEKNSSPASGGTAAGGRNTAVN